MRRVAWVGAAAAAAFALAGCGDSRPAAAPIAGAVSCGSCHTTPGDPPPFRDLAGSTDPGRLGVGAHDAHLFGTEGAGGTRSRLSDSVTCSSCHAVPRTVTDPGHLEDAPTDISFGALARTGGAEPVYEDQGCSASYCHGNFPGGNTGNAPGWLSGASAAACGTCHGLPPPTGRHALHQGVEFEGTPITCATCHGPVVRQTHVNGVKNIVLEVWDPVPRACAQACHGGRVWDG